MTLLETIGERAAIVYPGQGSQFVGMGQALHERSAAARTVFATADETLGIPLTDLCFTGPVEELGDTVNAQPAILTASIAAWEVIREVATARGEAIELLTIAAAGHSLGEFSALVASGVITFPDALRLVRERGRLMKEAGEQRPGGMAAIIGLDDDQLHAICAEAADAGIVVVANANCPGQSVISGELVALARAMELAKARGAKRVARLGISIASHSPLMVDASARFAELVRTTPLNDPLVPVFANVSATALTTSAEIRAELSHQIERPVNWTGSVQAMIAFGVTRFVEIGPGNVLAGLNKRINRDMPTLGITDLGLDLPAV